MDQFLFLLKNKRYNQVTQSGWNIRFFVCLLVGFVVWQKSGCYTLKDPRMRCLCSFLMLYTSSVGHIIIELSYTMGFVALQIKKSILPVKLNFLFVRFVFKCHNSVTVEWVEGKSCTKKLCLLCWNIKSWVDKYNQII